MKAVICTILNYFHYNTFMHRQVMNYSTLFNLAVPCLELRLNKEHRFAHVCELYTGGYYLLQRDKRDISHKKINLSPNSIKTYLGKIRLIKNCYFGII